MANEPPNTKMVGWYEPRQLLQTAVAVLTSTIFGRHSDHRLIEALFDKSSSKPNSPANPIVADYSEQRELWIDYVADVGDGWNSTYSVAYYLGKPTLDVMTADQSTVPTTRGSVLIFGGDAVYPVASRRTYRLRTIDPYEWALTRPGLAHPDLYAIPGNHDWYDSLESFTRLFIAKPNIAGCKAKQRRSYFAIKLPHGWWLLAADFQLGHYIDGPQVEYFQEVAKLIQPDQRIILCIAEPTWVYDHVYEKLDPAANDENLNFLVNNVLRGKVVKIFLAGDLHHYRRHAADDGTQKITSGGGGAFLHPTHGWDVKTIVSKTSSGSQTFTLKETWPSPTVSRRLCLWNLLFLFKNWRFGIAPALGYLLTAWAVLAEIGSKGLSEFPEVVHITVRTMLGDAFATFWAIALFLGFWFFTDTHSRRYRFIAGTIHGIIHLIAVFFIGWGAAYFAVTHKGYAFRSIEQLVLSGSLIFVGGWVVGSVILGVYLLISLNVFGRHTNEAFSSLAIEDWKNFLRIKIGTDGRLTIYPIGIKRVARQWTSPPSGSPEARFMPCDPKATFPELIEDPIPIP